MKYCLSVALCLSILGCAASEQTSFIQAGLNAASGEKYINDDSLFHNVSNQNGLIATGVVLGLGLLVSGAKAISNAFSSDDAGSDEVAVSNDENATIAASDDNATINQ